MVKNLPAMQETWVRSLGWEEPLEKDMATHPVFLPRKFHGTYFGFPGNADGKEFAYNAGGLGSIPGLGRAPGEGHVNPLSILA